MPCKRPDQACYRCNENCDDEDREAFGLERLVGNDRLCCQLGIEGGRRGIPFYEQVMAIFDQFFKVLAAIFHIAREEETARCGDVLAGKGQFFNALANQALILIQGIPDTLFLGQKAFFHVTEYRMPAIDEFPVITNQFLGERIEDVVTQLTVFVFNRELHNSHIADFFHFIDHICLNVPRQTADGNIQGDVMLVQSALDKAVILEFFGDKLALFEEKSLQPADIDGAFEAVGFICKCQIQTCCRNDKQPDGNENSLTAIKNQTEFTQRQQLGFLIQSLVLHCQRSFIFASEKKQPSHRTVSTPGKNPAILTEDGQKHPLFTQYVRITRLENAGRNAMLALLLLSLAVLGLFASKKMVDDYFSPPAIYNFFWAFALGCLQLGWVRFDPLRPPVWNVILFSYLAFMAGCAIVFLFAQTKPGILQPGKAFPFLDRGRFEIALAVLFIIGIFGFLAQLIHIQASMGLNAFLSDPIRAREMHTNIKYLGFFNILNVANFVLTVLYLFLFRQPKKWVWLILFWALATTLLTTDRTRFFYLVIWTFFASVYVFPRVNLGIKTLLTGLLTGLFLFGFFLLVSVFYAKQAYDDNMEYIDLPREYAALIDPYIYLTGSFPVLQAVLEDKNELAWGKNTFEPMVKIMELIDPGTEREVLVGQFYRVPLELNVCTYLEPYHRDFGYIGMILGAFFTGLLCAAVYVAMRQRKTLFTVYFAGLLGFCTTISIFVNHYTQTATWYFVIVGYIVFRLCASPNPNQDGLRF